MTDTSTLAFRKGHQVELGKSTAMVHATIALLAACVALNTTAFGIAIPIFGRRLGELGYGVADFALVTGSYAIAHFAAAPFFGRFADRIGRKPIIILALAGQLFGNLAYLALADLGSIIAMRILLGVVEAGMLPAALAVVADIAPARQRGRWLGVIMASYGGAFVLGPVVGGALFDLAGFRAAFLASAGLAVPALVTGVLLFNESLTPSLRNRYRLQAMLAVGYGRTGLLPRPASTFAVLLLAAFTPMFVLTYIEPQFIYFSYDVLSWSTVQVGLILSAYGFLMVLMQLLLGGVSDRRFERRWVIAVGMIAVSAFYWGMTTLTDFSTILLVAAVSGIGQGLMTPAIDAFVFDLAVPRRRASVMGLRAAATSLGAVVGPALAVLVSGRIEPATLFASAGAFVLAVALIAALGLRAKPAQRMEAEIEAYRMRSLAAGATLRDLAIQSSAARVR